jgi:hypothetical protein
VHRAAVDPLEGSERVVAHHDVLRDAEVGEERRLLVDDGDAGVTRVVRRVEVDAGAVDEHLAGVAPDHPAQHLDERRLAGAVLPHQRPDLAGAQAEVPVVQRTNGPVRLRCVAQLDHPLLRFTQNRSKQNVRLVSRALYRA